MPFDNYFYLASAGAGKTTMVADYSIKNPSQRILFTTYTHENTKHISKTISKLNGYVPNNITISSWLSFLLTDCVRPYQNFLYPECRIENLFFVTHNSTQYIAREKTKQFYMQNDTHIFSDKMSDFAYHCNEKADGLIIKRLEQLYDVFILDEAQDISGFDFELLEQLLKSKIKVIMVGDTRQRTYSTSHSTKNKKYSDNIYLWFQDLEKKGMGKLEILNRSYRCSQEICDFSDALFPALPKTKSYNDTQTDHDGIFCLSLEDLPIYISSYSPQILVYDKRAADKIDFPARNFGSVKGQTFERVVIIPTSPIEKYLMTGNIAEVANSIEKLYVAITRAKYSIAFVLDKTPTLAIKHWKNI